MGGSDPFDGFDSKYQEHMAERRSLRCQYCGNPPANNKQGQWGRACSGCKGSLTRMLRSGKYGPTYAKATKKRLLAMIYNHRTAKWETNSNASKET